MGLKCHLMEETDMARISLRRYNISIIGTNHYHSAMNFLYDEKAVLDVEGCLRNNHMNRDFVPEDDPKWPTHCSCGYKFTEADPFQYYTQRLYVNKSTNEILVRDDFKPGAIWENTRAPKFLQGFDGKSIVVICPNGSEWNIDGRANNCTKKEDNEHRCWCRHGTIPNITVDKIPEPGHSTCSAGGGSIIAGNYHGFLSNGEFT